MTIGFVVGFEGETVEIHADTNQKVSSLIDQALRLFTVEDVDPNDCHLSVNDRLHMPDESLNSIDVDSGAVAFLRLPF